VTPKLALSMATITTRIAILMANRSSRAGTPLAPALEPEHPCKRAKTLRTLAGTCQRLALAACSTLLSGQIDAVIHLVQRLFDFAPAIVLVAGHLAWVNVRDSRLFRKASGLKAGCARRQGTRRGRVRRCAV
jgi:hypothetical protein